MAKEKARDPVSKPRATARNQHNPPADRILIRHCLDGSAEAWSSLIGRYKNLIFSIPVRTGVSPDDAVDIFQAVCLELLLELPKLRRPEALPRWLVQITYHKCLRWKADRDRYSSRAMENNEPEPGPDGEPVPEDLIYESERSQKIREALLELDPRCRELIEKLFFESPTRPYEEVARSLGLAVGSIGPVRERCLERVRKLLEKAGIG